MQRVSTTVIAVVGGESRVCVERLAGGHNVNAALPDPESGPLERAVAAWGEARRVHAPYFVHDADPLASVADAWARRFDEVGPVGELEVAVTETLSRWRPGSLELPDYYLVLDADGMELTRRHWYLGFLHAQRPQRVLPALDIDHATAEIAHLPSGPWWPDLDVLLDGVDKVVPDQVRPPADG